MTLIKKRKIIVGVVVAVLVIISAILSTFWTPLHPKSDVSFETKQEMMTYLNGVWEEPKKHSDSYYTEIGLPPKPLDNYTFNNGAITWNIYLDFDESSYRSYDYSDKVRYFPSDGCFRVDGLIYIIKGRTLYLYEKYFLGYSKEALGDPYIKK